MVRPGKTSENHMFLTMRREPANTILDEIFSDFITRTGRPAAARTPSLPDPVRARMDVVDKGDRYEVLVDLPGAAKGDIQVNIEGARVSIAADSKGEKIQVEGERVLHTERHATAYARSFELPAEVSQETSEASFENGVLKLALPKRAQVLSKRLEIR
jgi:HSP20 family protein